MINSSPEEGSEKEVVLYKVDHYYCPKRYSDGCRETAPGRTFEIEAKQASDMQTYYDAFKRTAEKDPPICPVHSEKMIPQLNEV